MITESLLSLGAELDDLSGGNMPKFRVSVGDRFLFRKIKKQTEGLWTQKDGDCVSYFDGQIELALDVVNQ